MKFFPKLLHILTTTTLLYSCSITPKTQNYTDVTFDCSRETTISVRFYEDQALALLTYQNQTSKLQQKPTASGFYYTNMKTSLRGKGDEITFTIGRMTPLTCIAKS
ncbi:MliC family protein [Thalassotalea profundi]|uniref:C-type lysozyme inhibitor domain-containing protein n=1 Tax=Thalassotalea profundi TaxID=2036687 RepID=A0ABQ3J1K7_9GAMM|nr:MliC family protein [Thalassotalea profundi]GHE98060.1 hypothetical protein GCM10011501_29470 [Thalassotalea profundi]